MHNPNYSLDSSNHGMYHGNISKFQNETGLNYYSDIRINLQVLEVIMVIEEHDDLRVAMRHWATGVTVVSVRYQDILHGMTVSSFTSVSLDPKVISISLMKDSRTHGLVLKANTFGISILSDDQQEISEIFAGKISDSENRFDGIDTSTLATGSPLISGSIGYLDCELITAHDFGMNSLLIGEVLAAKSGISNAPLLYFNQQYHKLQE